VYTAQELHAVHARHVDVTQENVNIAFFKTPERGLAVGCDLHAMTYALKLFLDDKT
jgi:hypothetical protein